MGRRSKPLPKLVQEQLPDRAEIRLGNAAPESVVFKVSWKEYHMADHVLIHSWQRQHS